MKKNNNVSTSNLVKNIRNRYIKKHDNFDNKMKRNLQPEIEKLKSIQSSLRGRYINENEKLRVKEEIEKLLKVIV